MTFNSVVSDLLVGQAAKRPSWGGYVKKELSGSTPAAWAASTAYAVDTVVTYNSGVYVCKTAHTSGTSFDSSKFISCSQAYTLTFRERSNSEGSPVDHVYTCTPKATYGTLFYAVTAPSPVLDLDAELLTSFAASDWTVDAVSVYEAQRTGSGLIW